ncbi:hypothetical protein QBC41DRAFT_72136 [Cercophora samala]|uniref:Uncharacterized protein n=1 Tax=Cercophora samala TaxID=330535 RepID=A0AA40DGE3_9PEZI|nr:hypothetical protein QBC41DRAFT_72136 [Cercophora samala]
MQGFGKQPPTTWKKISKIEREREREEKVCVKSWWCIYVQIKLKSSTPPPPKFPPLFLISLRFPFCPYKHPIHPSIHTHPISLYSLHPSIPLGHHVWDINPNRFFPRLFCFVVLCCDVLYVLFIGCCERRGKKQKTKPRNEFPQPQTPIATHIVLFLLLLLFMSLPPPPFLKTTDPENTPLPNHPWPEFAPIYKRLQKSTRVQRKRKRKKRQ